MIEVLHLHNKYFIGIRKSDIRKWILSLLS
nr:MAG TPA: GatD-like protein [Caudoviricetes sp.]